MYNVQLASKHLAQVETAEIDLHHIEITKQTNHPAQDLGEPEAAMLAGGHGGALLAGPWRLQGG